MSTATDRTPVPPKRIVVWGTGFVGRMVIEELVGHPAFELVGVGGMGRGYRAEQKALGRTVAVKIIHPHLRARTQS